MNSGCGEELVAYSVQDLGELWRWRVYRGDGQVIRQGVEATEGAAERAAAALVFGATPGGPDRNGGETILGCAADFRRSASATSPGRREPDPRLRPDSVMSEWRTYFPTAAELLKEAFRNGGRLEVVADKHDRPCPEGRARLRLATQLSGRGLLRCDHPMARTGQPGEFIYDFTLQPAGVRALRAAMPVARRAA